MYYGQNSNRDSGPNYNRGINGEYVPRPNQGNIFDNHENAQNLGRNAVNTAFSPEDGVETSADTPLVAPPELGEVTNIEPPKSSDTHEDSIGIINFSAFQTQNHEIDKAGLAEIDKAISEFKSGKITPADYYREIRAAASTNVKSSFRRGETA